MVGVFISIRMLDVVRCLHILWLLVMRLKMMMVLFGLSYHLVLIKVFVVGRRLVMNDMRLDVSNLVVNNVWLNSSDINIVIIVMAMLVVIVLVRDRSKNKWLFNVMIFWSFRPNNYWLRLFMNVLIMM